MQKLLVQDVYRLIDEVAPFVTQESYDNAGLVVGSMMQEVHNVLVTLDVTKNVVEEAIAQNANLIVSHHPLIFHAIHTINTGDTETEVLRLLIKNDISLISAHTNLDKTHLSGSVACLKLLGLEPEQASDFVFTGVFEKPIKASDLKEKLKSVLHAPVRMYGDKDKCISKLAFSGGAYGSGYLEALTFSCDAYMTGEIRHHEIIDGTNRNIVLFDGGHYQTEAPLVPFLSEYLQNALNLLQYNGRVIPSECISYEGALE